MKHNRIYSFYEPLNRPFCYEILKDFQKTRITTRSVSNPRNSTLQNQEIRNNLPEIVNKKEISKHNNIEIPRQKRYRYLPTRMSINLKSKDRIKLSRSFNNNNYGRYQPSFDVNYKESPKTSHKRIIENIKYAEDSFSRWEVQI